MRVQAELGFTWKPPNALQRALQRVGATRPGSWLFQRTLYRIDRPLHRWSSGRITLPGLVVGLPVVMLTTTGARSGLPRTMPVAAIPWGADIAILGTNYAQPRSPAWVHNLLADPQATVTWRQSRVRVRARVARADEVEGIWSMADEVFIGFTGYRARVHDRAVYQFVLESPG